MIIIVSLDIGAGDLIRRGRAAGKHRAILLNVEDGSAGRVQRGTIRLRGGAGESDGAEVSESDKGVIFIEL